MHCRLVILLFISFATYFNVAAQKPFTEGTLVYNVKVESAEHKIFTGTYTFIFKGNQIRKELKMNNGFEDVLILNCSNNTIYSLQNRNKRLYVVELSMADIQRKQEKYSGFTVADEENSGKTIAGLVASKGTVMYKDGSHAEIYYTKEWTPVNAVTYDRFPNAKFFPLQYTYTDESGIAMEFEAVKLEPGTVENAIFRIPAEYKMISYKEYLQLSR